MAQPPAASPRQSRRELARLVAGQVCVHASMAGTRMAAPLLALHEGYSPMGKESNTWVMAKSASKTPTATGL